MKIAYIGDILNNGKFLQTIGTSIIYLLSSLECVEEIGIYCPFENNSIEFVTFPKKVKIYPTYQYDNPISIMKVLKLRNNKYDYILFNILPTGFGSNNISNIIGLCLPIFMKISARNRNIRIIYHNSVYTNDVKKLGYNSLYNFIRATFLGLFERFIFKHINTYVFLNLYKDRITNAIGKNKVSVLNGRYLEALTTVFINGVENSEYIEHTNNNTIPVVLMHGSWGPQKNLELGLKTLERIRSNGIQFRLIITGGINHHFPEYKIEFEEIMTRYKEIINDYRGYVKEKDLLSLFTETNLLLLPYNTPGGHSGVLEQSLFFQIPTVAIDFPEYREQTLGYDFIDLVSFDNFYDKVLDNLINKKNIKTEIKIPINMKVIEAKMDIIKILEGN